MGKEGCCEVAFYQVVVRPWQTDQPKVGHHRATLSLLSGENHVQHVLEAVNMLGHVERSHGFQ